MATTKDLEFGHGIDDKLIKLHNEIPGAFKDDPVSVVAALVRLDQMFGLQQDGDYVLVAPGYLAWLLDMVTFCDPRVNVALKANDEKTAGRLLFQQMFMATFSSPKGRLYTEWYPEGIRGKTMSFLCMSPAEASELEEVCTVREDGTFIQLPQTGRK